MVMLTPDLLLQAYAAGIFPMAESATEREIFWVDPVRRGILPLERFHVPSRLRRTIRGGPFIVTCNSAFEAVMRGCAESTSDRPQTWINDEIVALYTTLMSDGNLFYVIAVAPRDEFGSYQGAFQRVTRSIQLYDSGEIPDYGRSRRRG